jgi:hypothetical protein
MTNALDMFGIVSRVSHFSSQCLFVSLNALFNVLEEVMRSRTSGEDVNRSAIADCDLENCQVMEEACKKCARSKYMKKRVECLLQVTDPSLREAS